MNYFTKRITELKKEKSIDKIAKEIEIGNRTLKYYISGEREPKMSTLIKIADYFNVSIDYLVGRTDDNSPFKKE